MSSKRLGTLAKALGITAVAYLLSFLLSHPFTATLSTLFSSTDKLDFKMTDLFYQIADNRPVRTLEDRIVLLDIASLNRAEIAEVLSLLPLCNPRAVVIDVNFEDTTENDSVLLESLRPLPGLVLPLGVDQKGERFEIVDRPFFYGNLPGIRYGVVNFPSSRAGGTVREYAVSFPMADGSSMASFPVAAAEAGGYTVPEIDSRAEDVATGIIAYHSKEIKVIPYNELSDRPEELYDKIVIIGTTSEAGDSYYTPLRHGVSGVEIHAYAISTILDGSPLKRFPRYWTEMVAIALCFMMVLGAVSIKSQSRGLLLRIGQVASIYFLVWVGYSMFVDLDTVSDFSQAILMVAFGLFATDLWNGMEQVLKWCAKKIGKMKNKNSETTNQ